jgi:hypothetical protein
MNAPIPLTSLVEIAQTNGGLGVPPRHRLARVISEAMRDPMFSAQWEDDSDESFRPFAIAVLELGKVNRLQETDRRTIYRDLCLRKRVAVLGDVVGKNIPARVLKLLALTTWKKFSHRDWSTFFSIATGDGTSGLGHLHRITPMLVRQFALIPEELRVPGLLDVVNCLAVTADRWSQWQDHIKRADPGQRVEFRRTAGTIRSRGDFWDLYFRCEGRYLLPFSIPACFSQSKVLAPIASPQDMVSEAIRMRNCLANRISRVHGGNRVFFTLRDGGLVNSELVKQGQGWIPGDILGHQNALVAPEMVQRIEIELRRLAKSASSMDASSDSANEDAYVATLRQFARETFTSEDIARLATPLQSIQAKSISWNNGSFAIFALKMGGYIQFMSSPDGTEYLVEISSHKYQEKMNALLTAEAVALIEQAGFVWPTGESNYLRWFNVSSTEDITAIAEVALAIAVRIFGNHTASGIVIDTHIPE